ncbi:phosphoglycerate mutase [Thiorhodococcus minor]|uniref:Phosphoglycerate mutase n=1 Tax=Thiorhodococcus minor TaxID=57489 RepID=A0A6M0JXW3_9GAMM|nr:phosphoglycerate mutase [Thiorhodococcus minor]NEV62362.1 phosphoglycerate mutase [Thiorhodococcus minor]
MSDRASSVRLICPGLLGPLPLIPEPMPRTPVLDLWLARGEVSEGRALGPHHAVLTAFGLELASDQDPPTAPICLLGDDPGADLDGFWMHADPVHLRPDRDQLLVFGADRLEPSQEEALTLVQAFNAHFRNEGLVLAAPLPGRWYLRVPQDPRVRTASLNEVIGRPMSEYLPEGPGASEWMRLMNEAQMLFYAHPVNARREARGRPMLNGIWTWGGGRLPAPPVDPPSVLIGDDPLMPGLSKLGGRRQPLASGDLHAWSPRDGGLLLFEDRLWRALVDRDLAAWRDALQSFQARCAALQTQLRGVSGWRISLDPCDGRCWGMTSSRLRRFWRRGGLSDFLSLVKSASHQQPA